jgi:hypothetical protein
MKYSYLLRLFLRWMVLTSFGCSQSNAQRTHSSVDAARGGPVDVAPAVTSEVAPEPGSDAAQTQPDLQRPCVAQIGASDHCFSSAEEACSAIHCPPEQCTYLYGGGRASIQVACNRPDE